MSIFKTEKPHIPSLAMITIPNIILLILFFFVISSNMHDVEIKSRFLSEQKSVLNRLERKTLVTYICANTRTDSKGKEETSIQINDAEATVGDITDYILQEKSTLSNRDRSRMIIKLNIGKGTHMGVVSDIKRALLSAGIKQVIYNNPE
jgi:biopolymer transport protein ExbD